MRIVILGGGEVGRHIARGLSSEADVVVVDQETEALLIAEDALDVMTLQGDVIQRSVLMQAEVPRADVVLSLTGCDATNVTAAVLSRSLGAKRVIARVDAPGFYETARGLERDVAGIDACVCASRLIGGELLRRVTSISAAFTASFVGGALQASLVAIGEGSPMLGRSQGRANPLVRAVVRGTSVRGTSEVTTIEEGDRLLFVGTPQAVAAASREAARDEGSRAVLIGGGDVGLQMARSLDEVIPDVRVVDHSRTRCEQLARALPKVTVLNGDGTNLNFLREERLGFAEFVLAVTGSDEINLMASLLCRELGAKHTFALVHRPGYTPVYNHLGIRGSTSMHEILASTIHWLLPGRFVVTEADLPGIDWQILEVRVPPKLARALDPRDLPLGSGAQLLGRVHPQLGEQALSVPLSGGEHLVLAAPGGSRRTLERSMKRLSKEVA